MSNLVGKILKGRYRVDAFLGSGGMAEVYKAWDYQRATYLAMKLMREDFAEDKVFLRRFQREAETLAHLDHPNIVRFYGLEQDGLRAFILMDYVEGHTLRREIFETPGTLSFQRILEVMKPVCAALYYAHQKGRVHCDVKAANILIDRQGKIYLSDFGIARIAESGAQTLLGAGAPAYMAPDQILGQPPTPQTDIYALGVLLFEMVTGGQRPFTGERANISGDTGERVRWEHLNLPPISPRHFTSTLSPVLETIIMKCLEKDPAARYVSTLELFRNLEQCQTNIPAKHADPENKTTAPLPLPKELHRGEPSIVQLTSQPLPRRTGSLIACGIIGLIVLAMILVVYNFIYQTGVFPRVLSPTLVTMYALAYTPTMAGSISNPTPGCVTDCTEVLDAVGFKYKIGDKIPAGEDVKLWTTSTGMAKLRLSDGSLVYLDEATTLYLTALSSSGGNGNLLTLERGKVLVVSNDLTVKTGSENFLALVKEGVMGVNYEDIQGSFQVDCLKGPCQVGALTLQGGQRSWHERGAEAQVGEAIYEGWLKVGGADVPTPTAIPTATPTETPTSTLTSTPTHTLAPQLPTPELKETEAKRTKPPTDTLAPPTKTPVPLDTPAPPTPPPP